MSSRVAVGSSFDQATPSPIPKSTLLTSRSSKFRLGRYGIHSGAKPIPRPAETSDTSEKVPSPNHLRGQPPGSQKRLRLPDSHLKCGRLHCHPQPNHLQKTMHVACVRAPIPPANKMNLISWKVAPGSTAYSAVLTWDWCAIQTAGNCGCGRKGPRGWSRRR